LFILEAHFLAVVLKITNNNYAALFFRGWHLNLKSDWIGLNIFMF